MSGHSLKKGWTIRVHRKGKLIEEHNVPAHRLSAEDVKKLLISLVGKYEDMPFADFVDIHLNRRKGGPSRGTLYGPKSFKNVEKQMAGYECIGSTIDAVACFPLSKEAVSLLRQSRRFQSTKK